MGRNDEAKTMMTDAYKSEPEMVDNFLEERGDTIVSPYESMMPSFPIIISEGTSVLFRPVFNLPKIYPPSLAIRVDDTILKEFQIKNCVCKPEAPWLNRVKGMI
jgi:hypothetical protein